MTHVFSFTSHLWAVDMRRLMFRGSESVNFYLQSYDEQVSLGSDSLGGWWLSWMVAGWPEEQDWANSRTFPTSGVRFIADPVFLALPMIVDMWSTQAN